MSMDFRSMAAAAASSRRKVDSVGHVSQSCAAVLVLLLVCSACSNNLGPTAKFATFEHASVQGVVLSDEGTPLDSVSISFSVPPDRGSYNGGTLPPLTGSDGAFRLDLNRLSAPPVFTPPSPDTLTLRLIGSYIGQGSGTPPRDTVFVLVRFAPKSQEAEPSSAEIHISLP